MSQKAEKPTLSGARLKTRKRDEKEKYDPTAFRDTIISGLGECGGDLDQVSVYLDKAGAKLNYRRYADVLFDTLFAGGILTPGGFIVESTDPEKPSKSDICVFRWDGDALDNFYDVFNKLIRRYKYLEKAFEDDLKKILMFQKGFTAEEREKLATITGIILANGLCTTNILLSLFEDHLVKEGISGEFAVMMFSAWIKTKDINSIMQALKKQKLDSRLMEMFPQNKRNPEAFGAFFRERGLGAIADMQSEQLVKANKRKVREALDDMVGNDHTSIAEMTEYVNELLEKDGMSETEVTIAIWNSVMAGVEWNKKEDLVAEQAMRHLKQYCPLLKESAKSGKAELALMLKIQEFCYENMNFLKSFQRIILMLYHNEVLSEDVILKWYEDGHSSKGRSVFLQAMKKMVEWLQNAEEESDEEDED